MKYLTSTQSSFKNVYAEENEKCLLGPRKCLSSSDKDVFVPSGYKFYTKQKTSEKMAPKHQTICVKFYVLLGRRKR